MSITTPKAAADEMAAERVTLPGYIELWEALEADALREQAMAEHRAARD
jgi:hypothetical protein